MKRSNPDLAAPADRVRRQFGRRIAIAAAASTTRRLTFGLALPALGLAGCDRDGGGSATGGGAGQAPSGARSGAAKPSFHATDITGADYGRKLALVDHEGQRRTLEDYRGKVVMVFFGFTQCPDICPMTLAKAADVKRLLGEQGKDLQVILVSLDPERDSQEVLGPYVTAFDPSFVALRGDLAETQAAAREFRVFFQKVPNRDGSSYTIDHTAASYLIDPKGNLRLFVKHTQEPADVAADIRQLMG